MRSAITGLCPRDLSSSANDWQNRNSNLVLLTIVAAVLEERWCWFTKFLFSSPEEKVCCGLFQFSIRRAWLSHFTDEKTEAQRGEGFERKPFWKSWGVELGLVAPRSPHPAGLPCCPQPLLAVPPTAETTAGDFPAGSAAE